MSVLPFYVSLDAWLKEKDWLVVGWEIWRELGVEAGMETRDFLLPVPNKELDGFTRRMATYGMASAMSQALFNELKVGHRDYEEKLLEKGVGLAWTEHSERATMRTWAQAARIPEDVRRQMGRWLPSADEEYERSVGANVRRAQSLMAGFVKENRGRSDPFGEAAVLAKLVKRMDEMGYDGEAQDQQVDRLQSFGFVTEVTEPCRTPVWSAGAGPVRFEADQVAAVEEVVEVAAEEDQGGPRRRRGGRDHPRGGAGSGGEGQVRGLHLGEVAEAYAPPHWGVPQSSRFALPQV